MPLPTIADVARVAFNWENTGDSRRATNVMHFIRSGSGHTLAELEDEIVDNVTQNMWAPVASVGSIREFTITPLYDASATVAHTTDDDVKWKGGTSGDWMPQVAAVVKMTTALRGRSNRGRVFLPWIGESAADSSGLSSTKQGQVTTAWDTFANTLVSDGAWALCIASYLHHNAHQVINVACEKATGTVRRRNRQ